MRTAMNPLYNRGNPPPPPATFRLMDGAAGRPGVGSSGTQPPATGTSYSGNYIAGLVFDVTQGSTWFQGYWWWVPATVSQTTAQKFALWQVSGTTIGVLVPNSTITSGTLSAGAWNYVPLATPLALSSSIPYVAATGYVSTTGFPSTQHQFNTGNPYAAGITNGPLNAYAAGGAATGSVPQMPFSVAGVDPSLIMPVTNDADDLLWIDVQVTTTPPGGVLAYRAFPSMPATWPPVVTSNDTTGYTLGMEFSLTRNATLNKIWHYSVPASSTVLPTRCLIWNVGSQLAVAGTDNTTPSWLDPGGGAASPGDGWVYVDYSSSGVTLTPGTNYKVSTFHAAGTNWFGATPNVFGTGQLLPSGTTQGPLAVPGDSGATPGQMSWNTVTFGYPGTSTNPESDWVDVEVIPA